MDTFWKYPHYCVDWHPHMAMILYDIARLNQLLLSWTLDKDLARPCLHIECGSAESRRMA
jgi:hypothetical protein